MADDFIRGTANRFPFALAARAVFAADDLGQGIATADAMQEAERVADVALAARIGAHDDRERTNAKRFIGKVLEIDQSN